MDFIGAIITWTLILAGIVLGIFFIATIGPGIILVASGVIGALSVGVFSFLESKYEKNSPYWE